MLQRPTWNNLPNVILFSQIAFVKDRFIEEECKLLFSLIEISETPKTGSCAVTIDTENAFDSMRPKCGFGNGVIKCIELLLGRLESYVINAGITTAHVKERTDASQGDTVSTTLFILCL